MYTIVMTIPVSLQDGHRLTMLDTLARDLLSHLKYEPALRIIVPEACRPQDMGSPVTLDLRQFPGFTVRLLHSRARLLGWDVSPMPQTAHHPAVR